MEVADQGVGRETGSPPPESGVEVVAVTVAERADSPASLRAATWKAYAVEGDRPVMVADVPVTVRTLVPSR